MVGSCSNNVVKLVDLHNSQAQSSINYVIILGQHNHQLPIITSVDHKGVTCYGLRGHGVESRSLMTSVETRDLSGKADRSRVISNTKRVGKSVMSMGGCLLVAILNEKSFDQGSRLVLSNYMCVDSGGHLWWWVVRGTQRL